MIALALRRFFALALVLFTPIACSSTGGTPSNAHHESQAPDARYAIQSPFISRLGQGDALGVRVESKLTAGSLSKAQVDQLSALLSELLRSSGDLDLVIDVTSGGSPGATKVMLDVQITTFAPTTGAEREAGKMSHLSGAIQLIGENQENLGAATIWATGKRLDVVGKTLAPDTLEEFAKAILALMH
jgi:hypothetical protein